MAKESTSHEDHAATAAAEGAKGFNVRLLPAGQSDQPVLANLTTVHPTAGYALVDFGFVEPAAIAAASRAARSGGKAPGEQLSGRLAVRVALGYDALAALQQQIGRTLQALAGAAKGPAPRTDAERGEKA
ncbi:MAG: hypothetical protein ACREU5_09705 [Burkholderiales bacterium]